MSPDFILVFSGLTFLIIIIIILVILILTQRTRKDKKNNKILKTRDYIIEKYYKGVYRGKLDYSKEFLLKEFYKIEDQILFSTNIRKQILNDFTNMDLLKLNLKNLHSFSRTKRIIAAHNLGVFDYSVVHEYLVEQLKKEKDESVKFYIVYSLIKFVRKDSFIVIVDSIIGSSQKYQRMISTLIINNFNRNNTYLFNLEDRKEKEVMTLLLKIASKHINVFLEKYTILFFNDHRKEIFTSAHDTVLDKELYFTALKAAININDDLVDNYRLIQSKDIELRKEAAKVISKSKDFSDVLLLLNSLGEVDNFALVVETISIMLSNENRLIFSLLKHYKKENNQLKKDAIAVVLSSRSNYILYKIENEDEVLITKLVYHILLLGRTSPIIDFLNENSNEKIESKLLEIVSNVLKTNQSFQKELQIYLDEAILHKIGLKKLVPEPLVREKPKFDLGKFSWMIGILIVSFLTYPAFFYLKNFQTLEGISFYNLAIRFIIDVNYNLVFYFLAVNFIYLTQLFLSFSETKKQIDLWDIKRNVLLFENELLPSVSVIAPAFNEELSIIESVKSLLNLRYPDYNVIVVNDGSRDKTLTTLIEFFDLERKNPFYDIKIPTKAVRGVYTNKNVPNLIVVDKENGGKADALNVGINFSNKDFICGIDADSLLEVNSLMRVVSVTLDYNEPHIAIGGNISPVNGCVTDHGKIESYGLGKELLVKFQTLEYMRAFNTGRLGWSRMKSLLLVSGAFGVFDKNRIIDVGGYISSSGFHKKDSVGEDMELVVRLTRNSLENKEKYRVDYVYHALCYTELPNDAETLLKQRNRWHRGLLDILHFHRKMEFNYKYKHAGLIGMPYYVVFEMIGPFLEMIGYTMLVLGLAFGVLNPLLVLSIFGVTVLLGIVLSLSSLLLSERKDEYTDKKITLTLIFYAFIENIGYRQLISIHRVLSFFTALKDNGKWGKQNRKGFNNNQ